ncbi:hypothetical protein JCM3765_006182 [Sporobolomyces pararoseus]
MNMCTEDKEGLEIAFCDTVADSFKFSIAAASTDVKTKVVPWVDAEGAGVASSLSSIELSVCSSMASGGQRGGAVKGFMSDKGGFLRHSSIDAS